MNDTGAVDSCPRCGSTFHCGVDDAAPCPCSRVTLDAATLADLRQRYRGCLCPRCLAELSATARVDPSVRAAGVGGRTP